MSPLEMIDAAYAALGRNDPSCHVYRFRDGKAVTFQQYTDTEQWARLMK
jgi:ketosteroid isomerase-like protein